MQYGPPEGTLRQVEGSMHRFGQLPFRIIRDTGLREFKLHLRRCAIKDKPRLAIDLSKPGTQNLVCLCEPY